MGPAQKRREYAHKLHYVKLQKCLEKRKTWNSAKKFHFILLPFCLSGVEYIKIKKAV